MTHRTPWSALPPAVVQAIEAELGAPIIGVREAADGFSPAAAATVELASGRSAFVKVATGPTDVGNVAMQRHEAVVARQLPSSVPVSQFLFELGIDDWHVLAFEPIDGRPVTDPFAFMRDLDALYDELADVQVDGLGHYLDEYPNSYTSWAQLADQVDGLDALVALEADVAFMRDDVGLLHNDMRDDNALVAPDGRHVFFDWAQATTGPAFKDAVGAVPGLVRRFGVSAADLAASSRLIAAREPEAVTVRVAGLAGYHARSCTLPPPPNMPTLRAHQRAQAVVMLGWLQDCVGDSLRVPTMDDIERALAPGRGLA